MLKTFFAAFIIILVNYQAQGNTKWNNEQSCGLRDRFESLIVGGNKYSRGSWPFLVAIFHTKDGTSFQFICGSTLISMKSVVTAAHCLSDKGSTAMKRARELKLRLGAHNLANFFESNTFTMSVSDVTVHEDWDQSTTRFSHDIALLTTEDAIQFTRYVKPACLLNPEYNVEEFHNGIVPGFGQSEDKMKEHEDLPRELKIPIVTNEKCFLAEPQLALVASLNSFCGGSRQSEGVCQGDSGSGMFVVIDGRFHLLGIVSASLFKNHYCDVNNYAIFTNVPKHSEWIKSHLRVLERNPFDISQPGTFNKKTICGVMNEDVQFDGLSNEFQWTWSAAIFKEAKRHVTGTLISNMHVLLEPSKIRALSGNNAILRAQELKVSLGARNLDESSGTQVLKVGEILIHPDYKTGVPETSNIAILTLDRAAVFNSRVSAICLTSSLPVDTAMFAVGFAKDGARMKRHFKIVQKECPFKFRLFLGSVKDRHQFFCAGDVNANYCFDDSSILYSRHQGLWHIYAVGSFQILFSDGCDKRSPLLAERVGGYVEWIKNIIK